jgi:hypothetical protein
MFMISSQNYAGSKQTPHKIMKTRILRTQDKAMHSAKHKKLKFGSDKACGR